MPNEPNSFVKDIKMITFAKGEKKQLKSSKIFYSANYGFGQSKILNSGFVLDSG